MNLFLDAVTDYKFTAVAILTDGEKRLSNTITCKTLDGGIFFIISFKPLMNCSVNNCWRF